MTELARQEAGSAVQELEPVLAKVASSAPPDQGFVSFPGLLNHHRHVNTFLEEANAALDVGDLIEIRYETAAQRRKRLYGRIRPSPVRNVVLLVDFVVHQVMPKLRLTSSLYYLVTRGRYRVMTTNEVLGRMISCSFEILDTREGSGRSWAKARKVGEPRFDLAATYGPIVSLRRVGRGGKPIRVYKLRTMSPYAEYLQSYYHGRNGLQEGGKIARDSRITPWGRVLRRFWIDELPMLWNLIRGDLKPVGVRPLSEHYLSLYPPDLLELRVRHRPGLIPPFYADLPGTLDEITASERRYLEAYAAKPLRTDLRYGVKAIWNIALRGARSG